MHRPGRETLVDALEAVSSVPGGRAYVPFELQQDLGREDRYSAALVELRRLAQALHHITNEPVPPGALDITLYRDDLKRHAVGPQPLVRKTESPFSIGIAARARKAVAQWPPWP